MPLSFSKKSVLGGNAIDLGRKPASGGDGGVIFHSGDAGSRASI
jgi:hypothetical protein